MRHKGRGGRGGKEVPWIHINTGTCVGSTDTPPCWGRGPEQDVFMEWGASEGPWLSWEMLALHLPPLMPS